MSIRIKPSHRGLLHKRLGVKPGQSIPLSSIAGDLAGARRRGDMRAIKQDVFAMNARKWNR